MTSSVEVFSDLVCPWSFMAKRQLDRQLTPERAGSVRWRAFELNPSVPAEGADPAEAGTRSFGSVAKLRAAEAKMRLLGTEVGIAYDFGAIGRLPNTRLAHQAVALAADQGQRLAAMDALMSAYFERGVDIGDADQILAVLGASSAALELAAIEAGLEQGRARRAVERDLQDARRLAITGVPTVVVDGRPTDGIAAAFRALEA